VKSPAPIVRARKIQRLRAETWFLAKGLALFVAVVLWLLYVGTLRGNRARTWGFSFSLDITLLEAYVTS
jgi:hypothetical protein